jgi:hypothetical protein
MSTNLRLLSHSLSSLSHATATSPQLFETPPDQMLLEFAVQFNFDHSPTSFAALATPEEIGTMVSARHGSDCVQADGMEDSISSGSVGSGSGSGTSAGTGTEIGNADLLLGLHHDLWSEAAFSTNLDSDFLLPTDLVLEDATLLGVDPIGLDLPSQAHIETAIDFLLPHPIPEATATGAPPFQDKGSFAFKPGVRSELTAAVPRRRKPASQAERAERERERREKNRAAAARANARRKSINDSLKVGICMERAKVSALLIRQAELYAANRELRLQLQRTESAQEGVYCTCL